MAVFRRVIGFGACKSDAEAHRLYPANIPIYLPGGAPKPSILPSKRTVVMAREGLTWARVVATLGGRLHVFGPSPPRKMHRPTRAKCLKTAALTMKLLPWIPEAWDPIFRPLMGP